MPSQAADFNSAEYSWNDISISWLGRELVRFLEVKYTTDVEKKHIYGKGSKPIGIQKGNEKVSGEVTVGQSELEAMTRKVQETKAGAKITDVSFDINIAYMQDGVVVVDRIKGASLTKLEKGMKQGDSDMEVKLPFIALDVEYNVN